MTRSRFILLTALASVALLAADKTNSAKVAMEAAKKKEVVDGDLKSAIQQYKTIVSKYSAQRDIAADALVRMAECYEKLGDSQAREVYQRVVREFSEQKGALDTANTRLAAIAKPGLVVGSTTRAIASASGNTSTLYGASPDGRYLLMRRVPDGLSVRDIRTGETKNLSQWRVVNAAFSQDGTRIAFAARSTEGIPEAWTAAADGTGTRQTWHGEKGRVAPVIGWFPDNKRFLLQVSPQGDGPSQLVAVSGVDGSSVKLWEGPLPTRGELSLDGTRVAFVNRLSRNPAKDELRVLTIADSSQRALLEASAVVGHPLWTPDGRGTVFLSDRLMSGQRLGLWYLPVAGGTPELIEADFGDSPTLGAITRDGTLYYQQSSYDIREVLTVEIDPVAGKAIGAPVAVSRPDQGPAGQSVYSPDGHWLVYRRNTPTSIHVRRSLETGEETSVATGFIGGFEQTWFPDGRALLANGVHGNDPRGFYRLDPVSGVSTLLKEGSFGAEFAFSPDGKTVYYSQRRPNEDQTRVVAWEIETGKERELMRGEGQGPTHWIALAVSPDGKQLATTRTDGRDRVLEVLPVAGGNRREVRRVRDPESITDAQWPPDGRYLIFTLVKGGDEVELWRIPVGGGTPQDMGVGARAFGKWGIHPDGRHIAYVAYQKQSQVMALDNFLPKAK